VLASENCLLQPNFAEGKFCELRRCRSELHTSEDRKRKARIFEPSRRFDTPLTLPLNNP
jgi:hypothetical protein